MGNKGGRKHLKRLAATKKIKIPRKKNVWITKGKSGPHKLNESVPLTVVLRDYLKYGNTAKEAEKIIKSKKVMIDKRIVIEPKRGVGFMDLIEFKDLKEQYRVTLDQKGRTILKKVEKKEDFKLSKITGKKILEKGKTQLNFHDSKNILVKKDTYKIGDVLKLKLPKLEIEKHLKLEKGSLAYITEGKHAGQVGEITKIEEGTMQRKPLVTIKSKDNEYTTRKTYIFIIGKGKSEISTIR